jgi:hypothetical protein
LRIPVNVATQTAGKLPPKPVKAATQGGVVGAERRGGFGFLLDLFICRQIGFGFS